MRVRERKAQANQNYSFTRNGNFNGKKVTKSCCDYCEYATVGITAVFGAIRFFNSLL